jgi:protein phosphatase
MKESTEAIRESAFYLGRHMEAPESHRVGGGLAGVYCAACPGREGPNEDAAAIIPIDDGRVVLAIADGAGGMPAGAHAAETVLRVLEQSLHHAVARGGEIRHGIVDGFEDANRALLAQGSGSATTLVAAEIDRGLVRTYHVGDSAAMVVGRKGKVKHSTIAHSPVGYAVESGLLDEKDAMVHEDRHLVSNLVGIREMRIEIGPPLTLAPYDTILLASDGVFDNLSPETIVETIRKGRQPDVMALLVARCRSHMDDETRAPSKPDDLSFILFRLAARD